MSSSIGGSAGARNEEDQAIPDEVDMDALLSKAIDEAVAKGKGWSGTEREDYIKQITDDEFLPPLFATTEQELEKSGLAEAFSALAYDDESPTTLMLKFKQKGNDAFMDGKKNVAKNMQYYRDAVNHYYEASAWAERIQAVEPGYTPPEEGTIEEKYFTSDELANMQSTIYANAAMAHLQLKNFGFVRDDATKEFGVAIYDLLTKAISFNKNNVKAFYRLAVAHQMLQNWEEAGDAIEAGLRIDGEEDNKDLKRLQIRLADKVLKARQARQKRDRLRANRVAKVKEVWRWCKENSIKLGRVALVSSVTDEDEDSTEEFRWHHHHPHTGKLPQLLNGDWVWPSMFVYPSHRQSDFIEHFGESEMFAIRMAQMFPEAEDGDDETTILWDYNNEFTCSNLAVYFEVHVAESGEEVIHPECVEILKDQGATMRFYEASRALKGDEGPEMANVARCSERRHLYQQRKAWKQKHGSLWAKPDPCPVVRVHPAATLKDVLVDPRMVVPAFLPTFIIFPEKHPAHEEFLKEHCCLGILEPTNDNANGT